jgi:CRISPR-associated endonuclease/helicase Cas3
MKVPNGSFSDKYAHTLANHAPEDWEMLAAHLDKVASSAATFAEAFGARLWGEVLGHCHDLGKLSDGFQLYLHSQGTKSVDAGAESDDPHAGRVDHATFGARFVANTVNKVFGQLLAFCIAGHHVGLPDESSSNDATQRSTLRHKLSDQYIIPEIASPQMALPKLTSPLKPSAAGRDEFPFQLAFFTRMLFSCLIDAIQKRPQRATAWKRGTADPRWLRSRTNWMPVCDRCKSMQCQRMSIVNGQSCSNTAVPLPNGSRDFSRSTCLRAAARRYRR